MIERIGKDIIVNGDVRPIDDYYDGIDAAGDADAPESGIDHVHRVESGGTLLVLNPRDVEVDGDVLPSDDYHAGLDNQSARDLEHASGEYGDLVHPDDSPTVRLPQSELYGIVRQAGSNDSPR